MRAFEFYQGVSTATDETSSSLYFKQADIWTTADDNPTRPK